MRTSSVLIHWEGPFPFNGSVDSLCNLSRKEALSVGDIFFSHQYADSVHIVEFDGNEFTYERVL